MFCAQVKVSAGCSDALDMLSLRSLAKQYVNRLINEFALLLQHMFCIVLMCVQQ